MLPRADLDLALDVAEAPLRGLGGARLLLTGGTGFFGAWLLATLRAADARWGLGVEVAVLTRDVRRAVRALPDVAGWPALRWIEGDVRDAHLGAGYTHAILGAASASAALNRDRPDEMFGVIVDGTRAALGQLGGVARVLFVSSGAVYGAQPRDLTHIPEDHPGGPDPLDAGAAYGVGKVAAEHLATTWGRQRGVPVVVARPFAFLGPYLPLDAHFAVGNFVGDALAGREIVVQGDGTPMRSYLHAAELAAWLWTLLVAGAGGRAYNVGSGEDVSIGALARLVGRLGGVGVRVLGTPVTGALPARYVPDVRRVAEELGLRPRIGLEAGVLRMLEWGKAEGWTGASVGGAGPGAG